MPCTALPHPKLLVSNDAVTPKLFGTDGVRGTVGVYPMVPDTLVRLGYAIGTVLGGSGAEVIVGKDTRLSGYMVESAIEAGLAAAGIDIALTGPLPTSAVARLVQEEQAAAGIVISASHNPFQDNGIKVFDAQGNKLDDAKIAEIERLAAVAGPQPQWVSEPGKARRIDDAAERYIKFCLACVPEIDLAGMHVLVDAANGAAYATAPQAFERAGATVTQIGCEPDGRNINIDCGALLPQVAADYLQQHNLDVAVILDGDADRLILVDKSGRIIDGDAYLYVTSYALKQLGTPPTGVVGTLLSNIALEAALQELGVQLARAAVGDRNVAKTMQDNGLFYGSEPSGHILVHKLHVSGDGLLAALALLELLGKANLDLADVAAGYTPMPAATLNIPCEQPAQLQTKLEPLQQEQQQRAGVGRIILRPSGTEPVLRLLVEAASSELAQEVVAKFRQN